MNVDQSITSIHRRHAELGTPETDTTGKSSITLGRFPERHPNDTIRNKLDGTNIGNVQRLQKVRQNLRRTRQAVNTRRKVQGDWNTADINWLGGSQTSQNVPNERAKNTEQVSFGVPSRQIPSTTHRKCKLNELKNVIVVTGREHCFQLGQFLCNAENISLCTTAW